MEKIKPLTKAQLFAKCPVNQFKFKTTAELKDLEHLIGQDRALAAIYFGVDIRQSGFNLYALGPSGIGKHSTINFVLKKYTAEQATPDDWCYVHSFTNPGCPAALRLATGQGKELCKDMELLVEDLCISIPAILESKEYKTRIKKVDGEIKIEQQQDLSKLRQEAERINLTILDTPHGFVVAPVKNGKLTELEKKNQKKRMDSLQERIANHLEQVPRWQKIRHEKRKKIQQTFIKKVTHYLITELRKKYKKVNTVLAYLDAVEKDVVENSDEFYAPTEAEVSAVEAVAIGAEKESPFSRYTVNLLVSHQPGEGAPIIYADNPNYPNLIGRIEYVSQYGALVTDFTLIRAGALHMANGGYLILDADKILTQPYVWPALKQMLYGHQIRIESFNESPGLISTSTLEPEPIPLDIKVILLGDRATYYSLCDYDPDFKELFKVAVDYNGEVIRNKENQLLYARLIATLGRKHQLLPLNRHAVARVIEYCSRLIEDTEKLSTHFRSISDLLMEANHWAGLAGNKVIQSADIEKAIHEKCYRANRIQHEIYEEIQRNIILITTDGSLIGQINSLSVIQLGDFTFGQPIRVTAIARAGKGEIINIEREVQMSGEIHSKGILILSGFLSGRYAKSRPLSLSASLVFEQNYQEIDGDSASVAELCALLSALGNVPIKQFLAVTGSINQYGQVQAIGDVNEKIEGFFAVCQARGLTGKQGVLIPASNVKHLMLNKEVVAAASAKKFHIYPIETIDQAISLLTDMPAGIREPAGHFTPGSFNALIEAYLLEFAEHAEYQEGE